MTGGSHTCIHSRMFIFFSFIGGSKLQLVKYVILCTLESQTNHVTKIVTAVMRLLRQSLVASSLVL